MMWDDNISSNATTSLVAAGQKRTRMRIQLANPGRTTVIRYTAYPAKAFGVTSAQYKMDTAYTAPLAITGATQPVLQSFVHVLYNSLDATNNVSCYWNMSAVFYAELFEPARPPNSVAP